MVPRQLRFVPCDFETTSIAEALAGASVSEVRGHVRLLAPPALAVHQLAKRLPQSLLQRTFAVLLVVLGIWIGVSEWGKL